MRKDEVNAKLTETEIKRNKRVSKVCYIVEQYFGVTHLQEEAGRAWFVTLVKEGWSMPLGAIAFNMKRVVLRRRAALAV